MRWNWYKTIYGSIIFGVLLVIFISIYKNILYLNKLLILNIPVGLSLLCIFGFLLLWHIYKIFCWYFTWFDQYGNVIHITIHFTVYIFVAILVFFTPISEINIVNPNVAALYELNNNYSEKIYYIDDNHTVNNTSQTYQYMTNPKIMNYMAVVNGTHYQLQYTVYEGMNNYLKNLPRTITYYEGDPKPTDLDFTKMYIDSDIQKPFLNPLVEEIRNITPNTDDQARIAISLVQNIPYDQENVDNHSIQNRYPYEVLYTNCGACSEKSNLLVYLLRELNYSTVIFEYNAFNDGFGHAAVGILCPPEYCYYNTSYAFVETTSPSIMTYSTGDYSQSPDTYVQLPVVSDVLEVYTNGNSLNSVQKEYYDAIEWNQLMKMDKELDLHHYNRWEYLSREYGLDSTDASI